MNTLAHNLVKELYGIAHKKLMKNSIKNSKFLSQDIYLGLILQKLLPMFIMVELTPRLLAKHPITLWVLLLISEITKGVLASSLFLKEMQMPLSLPLPRLVSNPNLPDPWVWPPHLVSNIKSGFNILLILFLIFFHIPIENSFQALQNLHENLVETQGNAPSGLDGIVAASAVPVTEKTQTRLLYKATNTGNSCSVAKNVNTASKHTEKGPSDNINQPPLNTNAKIGVVTQSISQTDTQQLATMGDRGLQFQPTPESGQAFDSVLPNPNCGTYVR